MAVVTGGARGIGKGICETLAKQGAKVVIADLLIDEAVATAAEIENAGGSAIAVKTDITDITSVQAMVNAVKEKFGPVNILVNNAGSDVMSIASEAKDMGITGCSTASKHHAWKKWGHSLHQRAKSS